MEDAGNMRELFGGEEPPFLTYRQQRKTLEPCEAKYGEEFENGHDEGFECWIFNSAMLQLAIYEKKHHQGKHHHQGKGRRAANEEPKGKSTSQGQIWLGGGVLLFILLIAAIVAYFHFSRDTRETTGQAKGGSKSRKPTLKSRLSKSARKSGKKSGKSVKTRPSVGTKKSAKQHK